MSNLKGSSNNRNLVYPGKHALLPPKSPFPSVSSSYVDYVPSIQVGSKAVQRPVEAYSYAHHQRTSSESLLMEEQPSWLDDLLNEPDTPVRKAGHRRSSSDSFAYVDVANVTSVPSWGSQEFGHCKDSVQGSLHVEINQAKHKNRLRELPQNVVSHSSIRTSMKENITSQNFGASRAPRELDAVPSTKDEKQNPVESNPNDPQVSSEQKDSSRAKNSPSDPDNKRAKQQFAQRSRVRKLQYIAELERKVQALQAEWSEISAEIEFLSQQNLILSMENKALKQRLESSANEQLIKYLEHEVLEREMGRLRALHQQQQEQLQPSPGHRRTKSKDLDVQFSNLSLRHKDASSGRDAIGGPLQI